MFPTFFGSPHSSGELNLCFRASKFLLDLPTKHLFLNSKTNVRNPAKSVFCGAQTERKKFFFPKKLSKFEFETVWFHPTFGEPRYLPAVQDRLPRLRQHRYAGKPPLSLAACGGRPSPLCVSPDGDG